MHMSLFHAQALVNKVNMDASLHVPKATMLTFKDVTNVFLHAAALLP